jgi:hypothetical protein
MDRSWFASTSSSFDFAYRFQRLGLLVHSYPTVLAAVSCQIHRFLQRAPLVHRFKPFPVGPKCGIVTGIHQKELGILFPDSTQVKQLVVPPCWRAWPQGLFQAAQNQSEHI